MVSQNSKSGLAGSAHEDTMERTCSSSDDFELIDREEANLTPEDLAKLQKWLHPTDYIADSSEFNRHLSSQAPGTGLWICDTPRFQKWHDSAEHTSLWIKGVPGAGKSVTAASMIEHLKKEDVPVLFFFFRYIIVANRRSRSLVRDWLAQLLPHSLRLQATLQPLLNSEMDGISDDELWEYLLAGLSSVEKVYCVVDAMDEMMQVPSDNFLPRLNALATFRPGSVKLLMTSRPKQYLQSALRDASIVHISLEQDLVGKDIAAFVSHRLRNVLSGVDQKPLLDSLQSTICTRSEGLFLYTRLLLDQIIPTISSTEQLDVESLANTLPIGLEDMYNSMLFQQAQNLKIETAIQGFLLECASHSSRPVRLNELASFLAFVFPSSKMPGRTPKDLARSACAPLLEIAEDETVQVIHHSFTEFLLDTERKESSNRGLNPQFPVLTPKVVHRKMAIHCLDYLQSGVLGPNELTAEEKAVIERACKCDGDPYCPSHKNVPSFFDYQEARLQHPFLEYAVTNWAYHASRYDMEDVDFFAAISKFVDVDNAVFYRWVALEWTRREARPELPSALHIAAFSGLTHYTKKLLLEGNNVDFLDATERTPLQWACRRGHAEVVSLLLQHGAKPDTDDFQGVKPIHEAAKRNFARIVKTLLEAGVEPLTPKTRQNHGGYLMGGEKSTEGETAVEYVYRRGHTETILVMLPFLNQDTVEELLCECCSGGKSEAVQAILENSDVSVNFKSHGGTPFYIACNGRNLKCVELLLQRGANVNVVCDWSPKDLLGRHRVTHPFKTPLHALVAGWGNVNDAACSQIFRLLLKSGVNLEARDGNGETALLSLFGEHKTADRAAVKSLLDAGADASFSKDGDTILHRVIKNKRDIGFIELLLRYGCSVEALGNGGVTVLHVALTRSHMVKEPNSLDEVIEFLLKRGARSDLKDNWGQGVLELAIGNRYCSLEVFRQLLRSCPDINARTRCIWRIGRGTKEENVKFIRELMSAGVSIEATDRYNRPVILAHCRNEMVFEALLECGANPNAVDLAKRGVLHQFVDTPGIYNSKKRLRKLVEQGFDPHLLDYNGNNLLHIAAPHFRGVKKDVEFIQQILDFGISVNDKNNLGQTPLHVHIRNGRVGSSDNQRERVPLLELFQSQTKGDKFDVNAQDNEGLTLLHYAAQRSEPHVARFLECGADPNIVTKNGGTLLHVACSSRKSGIVGYLLSNPTCREMIDKTDSSGQTALHEACSSGRPESVSYLLKCGADVNVKDSSGRTPLHSCANFSPEERLWSTVQTKIEDAAKVAEKDGSRSGVPFRRNDNLPLPRDNDTIGVSGIIRALISAGADVTVTDSNGFSPLDQATSNGRQEMIQYLKPQMNKDEDTGFESEAFQQELSNSLESLPETLQQEVLKHPASYLAFINPEDLDWIIKNGGDITGAANGFRETSLLHSAARLGLTEAMARLGERVMVFETFESVRAVVETGDKFYHRNSSECFQPVLQSACKRELPNLDMVQLLVDKCGCSANTKAIFPQSDDPSKWNQGPSALHILAEAKYWWQLDAIKWLVQEKNADLELKDDKGQTPLHIAALGNTVSNMEVDQGFWKSACVELLLDLGADASVLDSNGRSCLEKASAAPKIMRTLLKRGGDLKASALFSAIQSRNHQTMCVLLDEGVSVNAEDVTKSCHVHYEVKDQARFPLFCAAFPYPFNNDIKDSTPLVTTLIERGADLYAPLNDRETLIHYVFEHAEYEIVRAFLSCANEIDFDKRDQLGRTVFLAACNFSNALPGFRHKHWFSKEMGPALEILDGHQADFTAIDNKGRNALHHLLDNPDAEQDHILMFLMNPVSKKLFKQKDSKGFTPLSLALRTLRPASCEALIELGADFLEFDPTGATALHHIASQRLQVHAANRPSCNLEERKTEFYEGCERLWQKFLDLGGDINARDTKGSPPLFSYLASPPRDDFRGKDPNSCCHVASFEKLFANTDLNARNSDGETALHVVARREKTYHSQDLHDSKLFEFMVGKGLDPLIEDNRGRSSLDVAAAYGQEKILNLFQYRS